MCMGCMEGVLSGCVGWDSRKMAAQLMEWSGAALMDYGGKCGGGKREKRKACRGSQLNQLGRKEKRKSSGYSGGRRRKGCWEIQEGVVN